MLDAIGNAVGRYEGGRPGLPCLMLGSHLDTVRDAGKYDGMLGVVSAIECIDSLNSKKKRLAFRDRGDRLRRRGRACASAPRFSAAAPWAGTFDKKVLEVKDSSGITMADALREFGLDPARISASGEKEARGARLMPSCTSSRVPVLEPRACRSAS